MSWEIEEFKWEADKVLPVWTADTDALSLSVRRHGKARFSWNSTCNYKIEEGIDDISGTSKSLKEAKECAVRAAQMLESEP